MKNPGDSINFAPQSDGENSNEELEFLDGFESLKTEVPFAGAESEQPSSSYESAKRSIEEAMKDDTETNQNNIDDLVGQIMSEYNGDNSESSHEKSRATAEKAKNNSALKRVVGGVFAAIVIAGTAITAYNMGQNKVTTAAPTEATQSVEDSGEKAEIKSLTGYEALDETIDGSLEQYDNIGCYESRTDGSVGDPDKVLEAMGVNPEDATAEERGAVQEYFAFSMAEAAAPIAMAGNFEGFAGLDVEEAADKIHDMTDEEKANLQDQLKSYFDNTEYHYEEGSGTYRNQYIRENADGEKYTGFVESDLTGKQILMAKTTLEDGTTVSWMSKEDCGNAEDRIVVTTPEGETTVVTLPEPEPTPEQPTPEQPTPEQPTPEQPTPEQPTPEQPTPEQPTPAPKNQAEADENSGASAGIVVPESQDRPITSEPTPDLNHPYNPDTNTYDYSPAEQAGQIGYEVQNDITQVAQESAPIVDVQQQAAAEQMVQNQTAPQMVVGTQEGAPGAAGVPNNFDAGATVGTGEVTGTTQSSDGSGNTIIENLNNASGNPLENPTNNYEQGF